jgi:hypothetical protein
MSLTPSEADHYGAIQENSSVQWNLKVWYYVLKTLSLAYQSDETRLHPPSISLKPILMLLLSHLCLGLPISLFPSGFPTKTLYVFLSQAFL